MKLKVAFTLLLLAIVAFAGCYTQVGYHASSGFDQKYNRILEEEKTEEVSEAESEGLESEDAEESEGYYGRRKYTRRTVYASPSSYGNYWMPYMPYPYGYYLPVCAILSAPLVLRIQVLRVRTLLSRLLSLYKRLPTVLSRKSICATFTADVQKR